MRTSIRAKGAFLVTAVLVLVTALTMSSCGGGGGGGGGTPPVTTGSFALTNNSGSTISYVYVPLHSASTWGSQQNSSAISNGTTWTLTGISPNSYDMKAIVVGASGTYYYTYATNFAITAGNTYTVTANLSGFTGALKLTNSSAIYSITSVYMSTSSSSFTGSNLISSNIGPSASLTIENIPTGYYYVRVYKNDGYYYTTVSSYSIASISFTSLTL